MSRLATILSVLAVFAISACKSSTDSTSNQQYPDSLFGNVMLQDSAGHQLQSSAGAKISIDGTSLSTTSDLQGNWTIKNVPTGTYNITLSATGFGSVRIFQHPVPPDLVDNQFLAHPTSVIPKIISVTPIRGSGTDSVFRVIYTAANAGQSGHGIVTVGHDSLFSDTDPKVFTTSGLDFSGGTQTVVQIPFSTLRNMGITSGSTAYFSSYAVPPFYAGGQGSVYTDPTVSRQIYTARGPRGNVVAIKMP